MKQFLIKTYEEISRLSHDEMLILISVILLFLPFEYSAAAFGLLLVYVLIRGRLIPAIKRQRGAFWLYSFIALEIGVSLIYGNMTGFVNALGMLLIGFYIAFYRRILNPRLFYYVIQLFLFMSLLTAAVGLVEFWLISSRLGHSFFRFVIEDKPLDRVHVMFYNANFYATMIDFFLIFAFCSLIRARSWFGRIYFLFVLAVNFFMLLLTGCRAALLPLIFYIPVFLYFANRRILFWASVGLEFSALAYVFINPSLIPRFEDLSTFSSRVKIWMAALTMIQMHPFFGMGPQTYGFMYEALEAKKAPHAHNIFLDALVSYGIVGCLLGLGYLFTIAREILKKRHNRKMWYYLPIVYCFVISALIHGLLDNTLNFWTTGMVFMMILNSSGMIKTRRKGRKIRRIPLK